jgi:hypothetical protein
MDTSFWIQCNPKITVEHTTKKYFGKYLYKIVVYCPAGRLIDSKDSMDLALAHRREVTKHINYGGYWGHRANRDLEKADIPLLEILRNIRKNVDNIKLRVEEPRIQVYAETENELKDLISNHFKSFTSHIESFSGPADADAEKALNSGAIIRKTNNGYSHKVILRDGRYTNDVKCSISQYLNGLGEDLVGVPTSCQDMLAKSSGYIWNAYFYTNDPSVTTFLNLINPSLVLNCHELVVQNK